jgi:amidase
VAGGLAPLALASDGGGSIRIPAACCGLFGLKPQRGRVSLSPLAEHWHGLTALGALARRVIDSALFLDAVGGQAPGDTGAPPRPASRFVEAARGEPGRLRVAVSSRPPIKARVSNAVLDAVRDTAELLRGLGHDVVEHEPDYGETRDLFGPRWLRGIYDDSRELLTGTPQLERRTRQMLVVGRLTPENLVARARRREAELRARLAKTFDSFDVLLTPQLAAPPVEAGKWEGVGALRTFLGIANWTPCTAVWNITGQPAAAVPAGFTDDGLPLSVQLVGRQNDEHTVIALSAQIERERPWADKRPEL